MLTETIRWKCGASHPPRLRRGETGAIGSWWSDRRPRTQRVFGCEFQSTSREEGREGSNSPAGAVQTQNGGASGLAPEALHSQGLQRSNAPVWRDQVRAPVGRPPVETQPQLHPRPPLSPAAGGDRSRCVGPLAAHSRRSWAISGVRRPPTAPALGSCQLAVPTPSDAGPPGRSRPTSLDLQWPCARLRPAVAHRSCRYVSTRWKNDPNSSHCSAHAIRHSTVRVVERRLGRFVCASPRGPRVYSTGPACDPSV